MSSEDQNNISNIDSMTACQFCGKCYKGIKIHISKAHPEQYVIDHYCSTLRYLVRFQLPL